MAEEVFSLDNLEQVIQFDNFLNLYAQKNAQCEPHFSLVEIFNTLQEKENMRRIFTAFVDIKINFILFACDVFLIGATWNGKFSKGKLEGGSVLDSAEKFFGKWIFRDSALRLS